MQTILRAECDRLYYPGPGGTGFESRAYGTERAAMDALLTILQVHTGKPLAQPTVGLHIYSADPAMNLGCHFLILAVTDRGASVYAASLSDLARHNLIPPQETPAC